MSAGDLLAADLRAAGVPCAVEARDRLALLRIAADAWPLRARLADASGRAPVLRLARERGFTHVALELGD